MTYKILLFIVYSILGILLAFGINLLLNFIFIPDPCYYHSNDGGWLFNLFYELPAWNGFHPSPNTLNYMLTVTAGLVFGIYFAIKKYKRDFSS